MNGDDVAKRYEDLGLDVEQGFDEAGTVYPPHRHEETYLFTVSGSVDIKVDDSKWQTLLAGSELVVQDDQLHEALVGADGWQYVVGTQPQG